MADYGIPIGGGAAVDGPTFSTAVDRPDVGPDANAEPFFDVGRLRRQYYDYLGVKMQEIEEQKTARRYYHGAQWTDAELKALKRRKQPPVVSNRIGRKIDAVTGLVERLRQEPKAYPRTPQNQAGADVATAVLRYALDHVDWKSKAPRVARYGAIEGLSGVEFDIAYGDRGDPDLDIHLVYTDTFFYDPRSIDDGFSDARYMGISKWCDVEQAKEIFPDKADEIDGMTESGADLTSNSDREVVWVNTTARKVRLIDHWYIYKGRWLWAVYIGNAILAQGYSPYFDERKRSFCKFLMFSAAVDHDGDRYGFVRNLKGPQDEINHRRSKALHILNSRRVISEKGAVDDVERARLEWARPDGWIETNPGKQMTPDSAQQQADAAGQLQMLQESKTEIENFGPNPALLGQGIENKSGRAISLLQQAGVAELGPYIISYRTWKIRVYRAIWNIVQRFWTNERWIRVTDDEGLAQFIKINGVGLDQSGMPVIINAVGALDVDIILDEGPDNINMAADAFDALMALAQSGAKIPPEVLIELAPLQNSIKQRMLQKMQQGVDPLQATAKQMALDDQKAKTDKTRADTVKSYADAMADLAKANLDATELAADLHQASQPGLPLTVGPGAPAAGPPGAAPPGQPFLPGGGAAFGTGGGPVPTMPMSGGGVPPMAPPAGIRFPGPIPPGILAT